MFRPSSKHVYERALLGLSDRPCTTSLKSTQSVKMADDEENYSGKIYGCQKCRNETEVRNSDTL